MSAFQLSFTPLPLGELVAGLTGTARATWPVWRDSSRGDVKFAPLPRKKAARLYHEARRFERTTRTPGRQDGALGRNGLAVLHALIFDFLNYATGALFPSQESIARAANISPRSVARGLAKLKAAGVVNWLRRCAEDWIEGRFVLRQQSNAYAILPASQWRGYAAEPQAPPPHPDAWGACPPLPSCLDAAQADTSHAARLRTLALDPHDALAAALARLGSHIAPKG
ncbi:helix-turn-helix domain-containing protein [Methylosinus sp. PW1]|uniref:helix-turn-helix domain-containing protein n=1 Tax=Methylosinus sp. PW1 TaxID=107636 RepID=UPI0012EB7F46|nr:helix-turn-helix domain-containing protein [Methylosinus sp. PW1]